MKSIWLVGAFLGFLTLIASGQTSGHISFEVATVKPALPGAPPISGMSPESVASLKGRSEEMARFQGGPGTQSPNRINYPGVTLKMLLKRAYNLGPKQILGPDWLDTQRYDIVAKLPAGADMEALRLMLQDLLAERFQMTLHRETRTLPVYLMVVGKNGPKFDLAKKDPEYKDFAEKFAAMKKASEARTAAMSRNGTQQGLHLDSGGTSRLAELLANYVDTPVLDRTKLDGLYSFDLNWVPDGAVLPNADFSGPSLFTAIEDQLGLRLQKDNVPVEVLVVDHAEKVPTSN